MLEPPSGGWNEGVQAFVAELLTQGYELSVRAARARSLDQLQRELELRVEDSGAFAGVSVTRDGSYATALLCRHGESPCERLRVEIADGELSRSRLALAVVERLRPIDLPVALRQSEKSPERVQPPKRVQPPERVQPPKARSDSHQPAQTDGRPLRAWLGGGLVLSSGMSAPTPWLSASLGVRPAEPWGLELTLAGSPLPGTAQSHAGELSLHALQAAAFAMFEPFARQNFEFSFGLGGGALHLRESASPAPGFDGFSRTATVFVVSARGRLVQRLGPLFLGLAIDPGMLVPALKVEAGTQTVSRIGRPWLALQASLGVEL